MDMAPDSTALLVVVLLADFAITLLHSWQEWKGKGAPLWRNFGAIVGLFVPDRWGFRLFTLALTLTLFAVATVGILAPLGLTWAAAALGALIGARLSDTFVSHVGLYLAGYRPNPGLSSTPLYVLEAMFIAWAFHERLAAHPLWAEIGFAAGVLSFVLVLPGLRVARRLWPDLQRPAWQRGQPMPNWASRNSRT